MKIQISFQQLTKLFPESKISGTSDVKEYSGISSLERANTGDISFLGNSKYKELVPLQPRHPQIEHFQRYQLEQQLSNSAQPGHYVQPEQDYLF